MPLDASLTLADAVERARRHSPFLRDATAALLAMIESNDWPEREGAWTAAQSLFRLRWTWAPLLVDRLPKPKVAERWLYTKLPEWSEGAPRPAPRTVSLDADRTQERLAALTGSTAEQRPGQRAYAQAAREAFGPRMTQGAPNMVLAEAGTGIGKTLGYLAPASIWAEKAGGAVWISTYTKALQRQLGRETERLFPDPATRRTKVVTRKGRENYLCLLNLEDACVVGDALRLRQVLLNLIGNGIKFTERGEVSVEVTVARESTEVWGAHFAVRDTGVGMSDTPGDGAGLDNVRRRLALAYGDEARLDLHDADPGVAAEVVLPASARALLQEAA